MLRWTDESVGNKMVDVVVSINAHVQAHYQQEVATANYSGAKPSLDSLDAIARTLDEIESEVRKLQGHPRAYMRAMVRGMKMFTRNLQGDDIPYEILVDAIQEVPCEPIGEDKALWLADEVNRQLTDFGYRGSLVEKLDSWLADHRIAADDVIGVADKFMGKSKAGTLSRVIDLPADDSIESIRPIRGVFWSGYSKYQGGHKGKLTFNIDRPWYEPVFAQILTHEGYPGHQAFYCRWDDRFEQGEWPLEAAYYLINTPTNALFEGGPETALHFLGWDDLNEETPDVSDDDKRQFALARDYLDLQRIGMTNASYYVNTGQMDKSEAVAYMGKVAYVKELEAGLAHRFFSDPIQRTYYPAYYYGRWMIGRAYDTVTREQRREFFRILYDTPHTTSTFNNAIADLTGKSFRPFDESQWAPRSR